MCYLPSLSALYYNLHLQSQSQLPNNSGQNLLLKTPEFIEIQQRAQTWHSELQYRCIDVRDTLCLNAVVEDIANHEGRIDGLIAAAAIQQETPALEYSAKDSNALLEVNVTGVFMTAQAVARQMVRFGNGGSIVLVASMSGTVVNRVCWFLSFFLFSFFFANFFFWSLSSFHHH
jgi:NAD(P)-dependent dehydrogenase (short-subunit alcohol dehydrogenase family)